MGIVDEERSACNLGTDVAELSGETEEQVVLLPQGTSADDVAVSIDGELESRVVGNRASPLDSGGLSDLG